MNLIKFQPVVLLCLLVLAGCSQGHTGNKESLNTRPQPEDTSYSGLRKAALTVSPEMLHIKQEGSSPFIYGVVMDFNDKGLLQTSAVYVNGETRWMMKFNQLEQKAFNTHPDTGAIRRAVRFFAAAHSFFSDAIQADSASAPELNTVTFYYLTDKGLFRTSAPFDASKPCSLSDMMHEMALVQLKTDSTSPI